MNMDGSRILASAVTLRAVLDYHRALKRNDRQALHELERFFRSDWFDTINPLQTLTGEEMMQWIREKFDSKTIRRTWAEVLKTVN